MIKSIKKRLLSIAMVIVMIITLIPATAVPAFAASWGNFGGASTLSLSGTTSVKDLGVSQSGSAVWNVNGDFINGSVEGTTTWGVLKNAANGTLTLKNNKSSEAILEFDYKITANTGSVAVDGTTVTAGTHFSKKVAAGGNVSIKITSGKGSGNYTKIELSNITLTANTSVNVTFQSPENGSYSVDGKTVSDAVTLSKNATDGYTVVATPAEGYKLLGWYSETDKTYLSTDKSTTIKVDKNQIIYPKFIPVTTGVFQVNNSLFTDLGDAVKYAQDNSAKKITLVDDGIVTENYTIPSGITLLIPFDEAATVYTTTPGCVGSNNIACKAYKTLTMAAGSSINVNGSLCVAAQHAAIAANPGPCGPVGPYGYIKMEAGSKITMNNGSNLYAWGYISGDGKVTAKSGSNVYELMQFMDFRGGSATSSMVSNKQKVFPFSQYYIQNIEAEMTLESGASESVYLSMFASNQTVSVMIKFIGTNGMFSVSNGGSFTKKYDPVTDRLIATVDGSAQINSITMNLNFGLLLNLRISSSEYTLPITNNMTLNVNSGNTIISEDIALLPGSVVNIAQGATLSVAANKSVYVYDRDAWVGKGYVSNNGARDLVNINYSPTRAKTRTAADLVDARIDVNGTINCDGYLYTTGSADENLNLLGGANIVSTQRTGKIIMTNGSGTKENTYQGTQSGSDITYHEIPIISALLQNGDGSYTLAAGSKPGTEYIYDAENDKWPARTVTITYDANGGDGEMEPQETEFKLEPTTLNENTYTKDGFAFDGWNTEADGSGDSYEDGGMALILEDTTLFAQWKEVTEYTITWLNDDGSELGTTKVKEGDIPEYSGDEPAKQGTAAVSYKFIGWDPELKEATTDATYKAEYEEVPNVYTVTWRNEDGTILESDIDVPFGSTPSYDGADPTKQATDEFTYSFAGWNKDIVPVTENVVYTAIFDSTVRTYTVTWKDEDGNALETDVNVPYGSEPSYEGAVPTKEADAQYTYTFNGWSPEINKVIGDIAYTAVYEKTINKYIVTWLNEDGSELKTEKVPYGTMAVYSGDNPEKAEDDQYSYTFVGWDSEPGEVTGDVTYTAVYDKKEKEIEYVITWKNEDGSSIKTTKVKKGEKPEFDGETPVKEATAQYNYEFAGWTPELVEATEDTEYTAKFKETTRSYPVVWKCENETLYEDEVAYGTTPTYGGITPSKEEDELYTYEFAGWTPEIVEVTEAAEYTASFNAIPKKYTVTWVDEYDNVLEVDENVEVGVIPTYDGETPSKESDQYVYTFEGWSPSVVAVTGDTTYTATFSQKLATYTYELYYNVNGENIPAYTTEPYALGDAVKLTAPQTYKTSDAEYAFDHWLVGDVEYAASVITLYPENGGEYSAYACYVTKDEAKEEVPCASVNSDVETVSGAEKIDLTLSYSVPEGYTYQSAGFVYSTKTNEPNLDNATKSTTKLTTSTGSYTLKINVSKKKTTDIYARGYVQYQDKQGELQTLYTDVVMYNWTAMTKQ